MQTWVPVLLLLANVSLSLLDGNPVVLPWITYITGPPNHVPQSAKTVVLDLAGATSAVLLPPAGLYRKVNNSVSALLLQKVWIKGLGSAPLRPDLLTASDDAEPYVSALPLWALGAIKNRQVKRCIVF